MSPQSQAGLPFFHRWAAMWILCSGAFDWRCSLISGVMISSADFHMPGNSATLLVVRPLHNQLPLGAAGLVIARQVTRQARRRVERDLAIWQPDPWPSTSSSTWGHRASREGEGSGIGCREADTVGGGVWHHAPVVTAASAAAAGHPGLLFEVLCEAAP